MVLLDRLRQRMGETMGRLTLPLSELIDLTSVGDGRDGPVVPKEARLQRTPAQATWPGTSPARPCAPPMGWR